MESWAFVARCQIARGEFTAARAAYDRAIAFAALLCEDDHSLFECITGEIAALDGLTHIETSPVMRAVKMHATMVPPRGD